MITNHKFYTKLHFVLSFICFFSTLSSVAQTREKGPWWPNTLWGANDEAGGSNWITPEKVLKSLALVKTGKIVELGHVYEQGMPLSGKRSYNLVIPSSLPYGDNKMVFNEEYVAGQIGQVGTQFDGPGHVGKVVTLANGTTAEVFYNGVQGAEMKGPYGLLKLGIENVKPIVTRGIFIDISGYKGTPMLPEGYEVTLADVRGTLAKEGLKESDIEPGDALLFNFGWWREWPKQKAVDGFAPYINREVIEWVIALKPSMVGSDANLDKPDYPVHEEVTLKNGIFNLEFMTFETLEPDKVYKFLFVFTPLRLKGATGSPGRPIAMY